MKTHAVIAAVALFSSVAPAQVNAPTASFASVDRVESAINELCELQVKIVEILENNLYSNDKVLTLSTCDKSGENRILIHSVCVGEEKFTN